LLIVCGLCVLAACQSNPESSGLLPSPTSSQVETLQPAITLPTPKPSPTTRFTPTNDLELPPGSEEEVRLGAQDEGIQFTVYLDYQSPLSSSLMRILAEMIESHPGEIQVIIRQYPLIPIHDKSLLATQAVLAAQTYDAFWEVHEQLLVSQSEWTALDPSDFVQWLESLAIQLELPLPEYLELLTSPDIAQRAQINYESSLDDGIPGAPFLFIEELPYRLPIDPINIEASFLLIQSRESHYGEYPEISIDPAHNYFARVQTNLGEISIQLFPESALLGVNSFVFLAREGWMDGVPFHRVVPNLLVESGDRSGTGLGNAGYHFSVEVDPEWKFDSPGKVGLVNNGPGTNGSQFFITLQSMPEYTGVKTLIGEVIDGMDILMDLKARDPYIDLMNRPEIIIESISIEERP
jgi:cyclophilin family peptidyl-prolyl cis-trans isomerase/protein-disulfide isomerase